MERVPLVNGYLGTVPRHTLIFFYNSLTNNITGQERLVFIAQVRIPRAGLDGNIYESLIMCFEQGRAEKASDLL